MDAGTGRAHPEHAEEGPLAAVPMRKDPFDARTREALEALPVPLAAYQYEGGKVICLLVSDGICELFHATRKRILWALEHDMYRNVPDPYARVSAQLARRFALEGGTYEYVYPERLEDGSATILVHAVGHHVYLPDNQRIALVTYEDVSHVSGDGEAASPHAGSPVGRFLDENAFALCVVARESPHELFYYNKAICKILPPKMNYDTGRTFAEFFLGDASADVEGIFCHPDSGVRSVCIPGMGVSLDMGVLSCTWQGEPAYLVNFYLREQTLLNEDSARGEALRRHQEFSIFLNSGVSNELAFWREGWKSYWIWNLSRDGRVMLQEGNGFMPDEQAQAFDYDSYRAAVEKSTAPGSDKGAFARKLTRPYLLEAFEKDAWPREVRLTHSTSHGLVTVFSSLFMTRSPDTGDVYLKIQNENVTERTYYGLMTSNAVADVYDCVAYVDGKNQTVIMLARDADGNVSHHEGFLDGHLHYLSSKIGRAFEDGGELLDFLAKACHDHGRSLFVNEVSKQSVKCVRIRELQRAERQFYLSVSDASQVIDARRVTYYDELTGLPNMSTFLVECHPALDRLEHEREQPCYVFFDIASMRSYNDQYGFRAGSELLKSCGQIVADEFSGWPVSRFSEDHFVSLCPREGVEQRVEKVHGRLAAASINSAAHVNAGLFAPSIPSTDPLDACDFARAACKSISGDLRKHLAFYTKETHDADRRRHYVLDNLDRAIEEGWIRPYYQPVVDAKTGLVNHFEALARWIDPEKGVLSPACFVPVLEESHLVDKLDLAILRHACKDWARLKAEGVAVVPFSFNVSRSDFTRADVVRLTTQAADERGLSHADVCVEITESALADDDGAVHAQAEAFHKLGFPVWLDDFGSGYSSLNEISAFDFDLIKLDMKFVSSLEVSQESREHGRILIGAIFRTAKRLGIETLTEGVETREQYELLRDLGSQRIQGYYFGRPMPLEDARALLEKEYPDGR